MIYPHSLSNYPKGFHGYVVSPHKICIQFKDVNTKLRVAYRDTSDLVKLPTTEKAMPITPNGVGIDILAIGCEMPTIEDLQGRLISAYEEYYIKHSEYYRKTYNKNFSDFIGTAKLNLEILHNKIQLGELK